MTDVLATIAARASATRLADPGPTQEDLKKILTAGVRAPDHGRLTPWRFTVIEGDARRKLADAMARNLLERSPEATPELLEQERAKAMRAPVVIVAAAKIVAPSKIPEIEQVMAVAAGVQNMLLLSQALGYGAMWKTGSIAYDDKMKALVGLGPRDHIVGFIYIGTAPKLPPAREVDVDAVVSRL